MRRRRAPGPNFTGASTPATVPGPVAGSVTKWGIGAIVCLVGVGLTGCTPGAPEPGLFDRPNPDTATSPPPEPTPPDRLPVTNPDLPVAGEAVWTSADGLGVQIRLAVHAVRRVPGATVLDWSITPIRGDNLRPGDPVPDSVDLGLERRGGAVPNVSLLDAPAGAVYRPLTGGPGGAECLCSPMDDARRGLRVGVTTMLQTGFPRLPGSAHIVDVAVASVPPFPRVPVTDLDRVPVAGRATDLGRPRPDQLTVAGRSAMFRYGPSDQVFRVQVHRVVSTSTFTSLEWAIISVTGGDGVQSASRPPFTADRANSAANSTAGNPVAATGPEIRYGPESSPLRPLLVASSGAVVRECLCSDLRVGTSVLRRPDKVATVVTNFAPLPADTLRVTVTFPGLEAIDTVVSAAEEGDTGRTADWRARNWPAGEAPTGWSTQDWPLPVPARVEGFREVVDRLVG